MMDDHYIICRVRNDLSDALKALLKSDIMTEVDFRRSRERAMAAVGALDDLLRLADGDTAKP